MEMPEHYRNYSEEDMRRDTSFLVGASYGRDQERERILKLIKNSELGPTDLAYLEGLITP